MTHRQAQFLSFIQGYTVRRGIAPSFEEIGAHFGVTAPSVNSMIKMLERNGLLTRVPGAARTLRVVVPAALLPDGEFGGPAKRGQMGRQSAPAVSPVDVAVAAALGVIETLVPLVSAGGTDEDARPNAVHRAALAAADAALRAGLPDKQAEEMTRRLGAETARWQADGRGVAIRKRVWMKRPR